MGRYLRLVMSLSLVMCSTAVFAGQKGFEPWHTTHGLDKFPCMDSKETEYFQRLINIARTEEKSVILTDHKKELKNNGRRPASVGPQNIVSKNFICPPFRGVRNPHPGVVPFGTASPFERIQITNSEMRILSGLKKNERWNLNYDGTKGYFEGYTKGGTPMNILPLIPSDGGKVRFVIQYLLWQDKTPPTLTLCYREDLHNQCNPYKKPEAKPQTPAPAGGGRLPASNSPRPAPKG